MCEKNKRRKITFNDLNSPQSSMVTRFICLLFRMSNENIVCIQYMHIELCYSPINVPPEEFRINECTRVRHKREYCLHRTDSSSHTHKLHSATQTHTHELKVNHYFECSSGWLPNTITCIRISTHLYGPLTNVTQIKKKHTHSITQDILGMRLIVYELRYVPFIWLYTATMLNN